MIRSYDAGEEGGDLPDALILQEPELVKRLFALMQAIDWKWPIDVVLRQDDLMMSELLKLRGEATTIWRSLEEQRKKQEEQVEAEGNG